MDPLDIGRTRFLNWNGDTIMNTFTLSHLKNLAQRKLLRSPPFHEA